jgi:hypothetical protein
MEQGFSAREKKPQTLDLFKFIQYLGNAPDRKILMATVSDIAVAAAKIAPIGDLEF